MTFHYHLDLEQFSLERFWHILETGELLPSHRILKEQLHERFAMLEEMGIQNLKQLVDALSTPKRIEQFAERSSLPQEYLAILRRRTKVYTPEPVPLKEFSGIDAEHIERLAAIGIKQTRQLYERAASKAGRANLARQSGVPVSILLELVQLSDLVRAGWVGPIFARLFHEAGAQTLETLSQVDVEPFFDRLCTINEEHQYTKAFATVKIKDLVACIEIARMLPKEIE